LYDEYKDVTTETNTRHRVYRICAIIDMPEIDVYKGDVGGYIEEEANLDNDELSGNTPWIYDDAMVYAGARVTDYATIHDSIKIVGNVLVSGSSVLEGDGVLQNFKPERTEFCDMFINQNK
jgi:hypothetical protein